MPYRPIEDAETLRTALGKLRDIGVSANALLEQLKAAGRAPKNPRDSITRPALAAFINGTNSKRFVALGALYDFLRGHPVYRNYFPTDAAIDAATLAPVLARFFTDAKARNAYDDEDVRATFAGAFVLYRPNWAPNREEGSFRVSRLDIEPCEGAMRVTETQHFPDDKPPFNQIDTGVLFSYGPYTYLLTKEDGGGRVLFCVVNRVFPNIGRKQPVEWFQGVMNGSSYLGLFPRVPFFCRRYSPQRHPRFGIMKLDNLDDGEALGCLLPPRRAKRGR